MDMWTDKRLRPFMAITAHWIEVKIVETDDGPKYSLQLRSALIGFIRVPGHHDGEHLAHAFLHVLDRIKIAHKVRSLLVHQLPHQYSSVFKLGWVTLDNAFNNDTYMFWLERELRRRNIPFSKVERRIRYV